MGRRGAGARRRRCADARAYGGSWTLDLVDARKESYYQTVGLLVAAGSTVEPEWITDELRSDPRMRAALRLT